MIGFYQWTRLSVLACLALLPTLTRADTHLTFCYDPYPPYALEDETNTVTGLKVDLLRAVVDRIDGVTAEVVLLPWKRCQEHAREGLVDGILPLFRNEDRETYLAFTDGVGAETSVFWYSMADYPEGLEWSGDYDDITHMRLGMLTGGHIDTGMQDAFSKVRPIQRTAGIESLYLMLFHGRVDLVATDLQVGRFHTARAGWSERFAPIAHPIAAQVPHFGLSKASGAARFVEQFNAALADMQASGEIDAIYATAPQ